MAAQAGRKTGTKTGTKARTAKTGGTSKSGAKKRQTNAAAGQKRRQTKRSIAKQKSFIRGEIAVILTAFFGLMLFLCNFGLFGAVGGFFSDIEKGLFGMVSYVFPLMLIAVVWLYVANRGSYFAVAKLSAAMLIILIVCSIMQLLFGGEALLSLPEYYRAGAEGALGGGVIGGVLAGILRGLAGRIGAYLILIVLFIVCMVIVTEKSFVNAAKAGAEKTARAAKAGHERYMEYSEESRIRREARREEMRLKRAEEGFPSRGVRGAFDVAAAADEARIYAGYGRDIIGEEQPGLEALNEADYRAEAREAAGFGFEDDSETKVISQRQDQFVGKITEAPVYDYDDDSVPFEEASELDKYKSYRDIMGLSGAKSEASHGMEALPEASAGSSAVAGQRAGIDGADVVLDLKAAAEFGYAVGTERRYGETAGEIRDFVPKSAKAFCTETEAGRASDPEAQRMEKAENVSDAGSSSDRISFETASGKSVEGASEYEKRLILMKKQSSYGEELPKTETEGGYIPSTEEDYADVDANAEQAVAASKMQHAGAKAAGGSATAETAGSGSQRETALRNGAQGSAQTANAGTAQGAKQANVPTEAERQQMAAEIKKQAAPPPRPYVCPPLSLLKKGPKSMAVDQIELRETAIKLQQVLHTFGVGVTVTNVTRGPSVTRYEMTPDVGVKVSKITSLTDDIKLALAAADIRIEAPIPGKSAVGIEVPNRSNTMVYLRDILETPDFREAKSKVSFAIGKDIQGQPVVGNIAKMPHLLVAGETGSGKSVGINTLIMSLIYKAKPEEVRLIMIDPKVVELSVYNGIPHLLIPVVTDPKKAVSALNWAVAEMNDRYKKFAETGTRNISGYNEKIQQIAAKLPEEERPQKLSQIVIIIDELAELMMTASKEVEASIVRLAQLARAAGMHLVIATQRPTVDVITGLIKANVPSRIAFKTFSGLDSRTILDMNGAETLLGNGDMLYFPSGAKKPVRVQGAFVSDEEVEHVVKFLKKNGAASYENEVAEAIANSESRDLSLMLSGADGAGTNDGRDEYFAEAGRLITDKQKASIGMLQRMYKIGFNRAARIMDQLCEAGVVGEEEGTKPRKVLMTRGEFDAFLNA